MGKWCILAVYIIVVKSLWKQAEFSGCKLQTNVHGHAYGRLVLYTYPCLLKNIYKMIISMIK